jgi:hypothetical protein
MKLLCSSLQHVHSETLALYMSSEVQTAAVKCGSMITLCVCEFISAEIALAADAAACVM